MLKRALLLSFLTCFAALATHADDWSKSFAISRRAQLKLNVDDAHVHVTACDCKEVAAHVTTVGYRIATDEVRITEQQNGDSVSIEVRVPNLHFNWTRHSVEVDLRVPRTSDLDLHTGDGHMDVTGVSGDLHFESGDGHIEGTALDGRLRAHSGDGHITVSGRFDALDLESGDGRIEADVRSGSKNTSAWRIHTGDGGIRLRLPSDFSAELDARTGDGHVNLELPVTLSGPVRSNHVQGRLNNGGPALNITTGDGSIVLQRGL